MGWQSNTGATLGGMLGGPLGSLAGQYIGSHFENNGKHSNTSTFSNQQKGFNYGDLASDALGAYASYRGERDTREAMANAGKLNLAHTRKEATENGFNPLTVLRATGGQGSTHSADHGKLASAAFWSTFANQNSSQSRANLYNTRASTRSMNNSLNERGRDDVPLIVKAFDPTGKIRDFYIPNPEILEFSASEFLASASAISASFAIQNNVTKAEAKDIIMSILQNRKKTIASKEGKGVNKLIQVNKLSPANFDPLIYHKQFYNSTQKIVKSASAALSSIFPTDWDNRNYRKEPFP